MRPLDDSAVLRMIRRIDPVHTGAWVSAASLLIAGWVLGSALGLWDAQVGSGLTVCLDSDGNCPVTAASPDVAGEFATFGLLMAAGIASFVAALFPLLQKDRRRQNRR